MFNFLSILQLQVRSLSTQTACVDICVNKDHIQAAQRSKFSLNAVPISLSKPFTALGRTEQVLSVVYRQQILSQCSADLSLV